MAAATEEVVRFRNRWICKLSDILSAPLYPDGLCSPTLRTVHNNLGFDWRLKVSAEQSRFFVHVVLVGAKSSCLAECSISVGKAELSLEWKMTFQRNRDPDRCKVLFKSEFQGEAVDGLITIGFYTRIAESQFLKTGIHCLPIVQSPSSQDKGIGYSLFDKILIQKKNLAVDEAPKQPDADIHQKRLDFHIQTSDGYIIWCHSLVLVSGNDKFANMMESGLSEAKQSSLKVRFSSNTMKEVLHVIYRGSVSEKFQDLPLDEILDASTDYHVQILRRACEEELLEQCEQLDGESGARVLVLGDRYGMVGVKRKALDWASDHPAKVFKSDAGRTVMQDPGLRNLFDEISESSEAKLEQRNKDKASQP